MLKHGVEACLHGVPVTGEVTERLSACARIVGLTRPGNPFGLMERDDMSLQRRHRAWMGCILMHMY